MRTVPTDRNMAFRIAAAIALAVSGGIHLRLYRDGYRDIHIDRVLGVDLGRSFAIAIVAATVISVLLVAATLWHRSETIVSIMGIAYAAGALVAYGLSRTVGLLGFDEDRWSTEALISKPIELAAIVLLGITLVGTERSRTYNWG
jgi:hypothetical protein